MKYFFILFFSLLLAKPSSNDEPTIKKKPFVVVQLFTSLGCSYCPPADELMTEIKEDYQDQEVYVLSYHVDYWDRKGWKDPFSKKSFTELQYSYAKQFKQRRVYTPQVVINGKDYFNGTYRSKLKKKIKNYLKKEAKNTITLSYSKNEDGNLALNYEVLGEISDKKLKLAFVLKTKTTDTKRNEGHKKMVTNTNIVIEEMMIDLSSKNTGSILIPEVTLEVKKDLLIIGYIQNKKLRITGATQLEF
tara:strand:+ start:274 stop:1011 length:738 start_codon:yes stop_codon:yes gene_type:complete